MRNLTWFLCCCGVLSGCAANYISIKPAELDARLAGLEDRRLHQPDRADPAQLGSIPPVPSVAHRVADRSALDQPLSLVDQGESVGETSDREKSVDSASTTGPARPRHGPLPSFWQTVKRDVKQAPRELWADTKRVYGNPLNLAILGAAYGGSLAIRESGVDFSIEHHFQEKDDFRPAHHHFNEDWRDAFGAIGNPATHFALAGAWYLLGQQTLDDKTYEVGKTLFSALTINGITVFIGQAATYDKAPNGEQFTFPSGHTSSSFVVASVMHEAYGLAVGAPLYGLAVLAAYERVEDGEHYFSDVVMGGVLGLVVGHSVASGRDPEFFGWKIVPWASPQNGAGIAFRKTLD